jgi:N-acetylglucosamine kinase-like BadF-type ATPase
MTVRHYLAIDGGNSKTDVVIGREDGQILTYVNGPGASPDELGLAGSIRVLGNMVSRALTEAGAQVDLLVAYLAGVDLPIEVERFAKAVGDAGWAPDHVVDNDLFALLRAGTSDPDAIAVVCGAGINCVGRRADGRTTRFPALGQLTGDWGGGHHLADLALWHAARGEDTRGPFTALTAAVAAHFHADRVEDVSAAIHLGEIDRARVQELTPLLFEMAEAGDEVAARVVDKQAREIVSMARIAGERLKLSFESHTIVLGGGVLTARWPSLNRAINIGLATVAPRASVVIAADPPVTGAALLALDQWSAVTEPVDGAVRAGVRQRMTRLLGTA